MANINILNYCASARNNVLATFSMPLDQGELSSTSTELSILSARSTPQRVQWYPFGARHPDGSYKYIRGACMTDMAAWESKSCQVVIGGGYVPTTYTPRFNRALGGIVIQFGLANEWIRLDLESATLLEGGGATDHYARYRLFTRLPVSRQYWIEFVYEIANDSPVVHYWLYFGNSFIRAGQPTTTVGQYAQVNPPGDSSGSAELVVIGAGAYLTMYDLIRSISPRSVTYDWSRSVNGTIVTNNWVISDPRAPIPARASCYSWGMARCARGSIFIGDGSDPTILAEHEVQLSTLANNWNGRVPPAFSEVPVFTALSDAATSNGRSVPNQVSAQVDNILSTCLANMNGAVGTEGMSWLKSEFGMKPPVQGPSGTGWRYSINNCNLLQHMLMFGHPQLMPLIAQSAQTFAYRCGVFREEDGTYLSRSRFPNACFWLNWPLPARYTSSLNGGDNLGYGEPATQFFEPHFPGNYQPPDQQHDESAHELLYGLLSGDWFGLALNEMMGYKYPLQYRTDNTGSGTLDTFGAARCARYFKAMIVCYEATGFADVVQYSILGRLTKAYQQMVAFTSDPLGDLSTVKILNSVNGTQPANLNNGYYGTIPWQDAIAVNHMWLVVRFLEKNGVDPSLVSVIKSIIGNLAGSTLLYHIPSVYDTSSLRLLYIYGAIPTDGSHRAGDTYTADGVPGWSGVLGSHDSEWVLMGSVPSGATWLPRWTLIRNTRTNATLNVSFQAGPWTVIAAADQGGLTEPSTHPTTRTTWRGVSYGTPLTDADITSSIPTAQITSGIVRSTIGANPRYCVLGNDYVNWIGGVVAVAYKMALANSYGAYNSAVLSKATAIRDFMLSQLASDMGSTWPMYFLPYFLIDDNLMDGTAVITLQSVRAAPARVYTPTVTGVSVVDTIINMSGPARSSGTVNLPLVVITNPGINATAAPNAITGHGRVNSHSAAGYTQVVNVTVSPAITTSTTDVPTAYITTFDSVRGVVTHANMRIQFSCQVTIGDSDGLPPTGPENEPVSETVTFTVPVY